MARISDLLKQKIAGEKLSLAAAAKKIGVSVPSVRSASSGSAAPNARSIGKYAKFLGIPLEQAVAMVEAQKGAGGKRGARSGKGRRGRPPGRAAKAGRHGPGRPPGTGRRGRPPAPGGGKRLQKALQRAYKALAKVDALVKALR